MKVQTVFVLLAVAFALDFITRPAIFDRIVVFMFNLGLPRTLEGCAKLRARYGREFERLYAKADRLRGRRDQEGLHYCNRDICELMNQEKLLRERIAQIEQQLSNKNEGQLRAG